MCQGNEATCERRHSNCYIHPAEGSEKCSIHPPFPGRALADIFGERICYRKEDDCPQVVR